MEEYEVIAEMNIPPKIQFEEDFRRYTYVKREDGSKLIHVYLIEDIEEPESYTSILKVLSLCKPEDEVIFHINSDGGRVSGALSLITAIKQCKAKTIAEVTSAASAATLITFACDKVILHYESEFMIHDRTSGSYGTGKDNRKLAKHQDEYFMHLTMKYYRGFLSVEEIEKINLDSETEWFMGNNLKSRMQNWASVNNKEFEYLD